jgi:hypothetical protein
MLKAMSCSPFLDLLDERMRARLVDQVVLGEAFQLTVGCPQHLRKSRQTTRYVLLNAVGCPRCAAEISRT